MTARWWWAGAGLSDSPKVLVTGASGTNGRELVKRLSSAGVAVRGMIHNRQARADAALPGVEFVIADFDDPASVGRVLEGIDRAFLVTNSTERAEAQQLAFVARGRAAGLRHIVYSSQLHAAKNSPVRYLRYHAVVEDAISSSGLAFTILRPNLYMQAFLGFRSSIVAEGRFFAPVGDARVSIVDVRDIAAVAAAALTENGHEGKTYDITGPEALTHRAMAAQLSESLGRDIKFVDIPEAAMREALLSLKFPEWQADGLIEDYAHYRRGEASGISTAVLDVTGRPPCSFLAFARDHIQALSQ
jgi:uncharacterized protein YbjT (DUF2867 family)